MRTEPYRTPRLRAEPSKAPPPSGPGGGASGFRPPTGGVLMPQQRPGPRLRGRPLFGRRRGGTSHDARGDHARRQRRRAALDAVCPDAEHAAAERARRRRSHGRGGTGRRTGLRSRRASAHGGSTPSARTFPCQVCGAAVRLGTGGWSPTGRSGRRRRSRHRRRRRSPTDTSTCLGSSAGRPPGSSSPRLSQHRGRAARHAPAKRGTAVRIRPVFLPPEYEEV
jgi:hypothetical protein